MAAEVTVTLKGGPGYADPWIVVRGDPDEVDEVLARLTEDSGSFTDVTTLAQRFIDTKPAGIQVVQQAFPGSKLISDEKLPPTGPVPQTTPPCEKCGEPTVFASGNGANGKWAGYRCTSGDRDHFKFLSQ